MTASRILGTLGQVAASTGNGMSAAELAAAVSRLWIEADVAVVHIDELPDHVKPAVRDLMARKHGRKMRR